MSAINDAVRRRRLILLLYAPGQSHSKNEPVNGITRLQKLLFLIQKETKVSKVLAGAFEFSPFRYGPYSPELYDDIEFLESFGVLAPAGLGVEKTERKRGVVRLPASLKVEVERRNASASDVVEARQGFTHLLDYDAQSAVNSEYEQRVFSLTDTGIQHAIRALDTFGEKVAFGLMGQISAIKTKYGSLPLRVLLRDVYARYPEYATQSEITDQ